MAATQLGRILTGSLKRDTPSRAAHDPQTLVGRRSLTLRNGRKHFYGYCELALAMRTHGGGLFDAFGTERATGRSAFPDHQKGNPGSHRGNYKRQNTPPKRVSI
jgi:hypothetical protein